MKVFLYGRRGTGKSTIIEKLLSELKLKPSGFRTVRGPACAGGKSCFYITGASAGFDPDNMIGYSFPDGSWGSFCEVFDDRA